MLVQYLDLDLLSLVILLLSFVLFSFIVFLLSLLLFSVKIILSFACNFVFDVYRLLIEIGMEFVLIVLNSLLLLLLFSLADSVFLFILLELRLLLLRN